MNIQIYFGIAIIILLITNTLLYLECKSHSRFATGPLTDKELGEVIAYLYRLHNFNDIKLVELSKSTPCTYNVKFNDNTSIEYVVFKIKGFSFNHIQLNDSTKKIHN